MAHMISLVLEASTYAGSVALLDGDQVIAERSLAMRGKDEEALMPAVAEALSHAGVTIARLNRVVCGAGPGAFTSLRIAGSIAKGLALSRGIPLIPVSSLALLLASQPALATAGGRYLAVLDAMRDEQYAQLYVLSAHGALMDEGPPFMVPTSRVIEHAHELNAVLVGPSYQSVPPHARGAARITNIIDATAPADLASWEPAYGRRAEAQVKWEAEHGRPLVAG
jgi:tRNA threonylcarbamoyladenosine biosynthesis protein TsaB